MRIMCWTWGRARASSAGTWAIGNVNAGILFLMAITSIGVYGITLAGWASGSKYPLLGSVRATAQMISYELPMAMAIAAPLLMLNSLSFRELVDGQGGFYFGFIPRWAIFQGPFPQIISFLIFLIAAFAETNRVPFDLPEAENELVAGFHTEYGSMKFAAFFMAEYCNMVTVSCVGALLFLGGWQPLGPAEYGSQFVPTLVFAVSTSILLSLAALFTLGALDMISMVIRGALVQLETPDEMRGRVSAVNAIFINTSNQLGEFESGITAQWFGTVPSVVIGGIGTLIVVALWMHWFPALRERQRLESGEASP